MHGRYFLAVTVIVFWCAAVALPVLAGNGGYEGLMAPAEPETGPSPAGEENPGYSGILAPSPNDRALTGQQEEPPGYAGVLPGRVEQSQPEAPPEPAQAQMTPRPGAPLDAWKAQDAAGLELMSMVESWNQDQNDGLMKPERLPEEFLNSLKGGYTTTIEGKKPVVYIAEKQIEQWIKKIDDGTLSKKERSENARKALQEISPMAEGLRFQKSIPDSTYKQMGLPDDYIRNEKEGTESALALLDQFIKKLKKY